MILNKFVNTGSDDNTLNFIMEENLSKSDLVEVIRMVNRAGKTFPQKFRVKASEVQTGDKIVKAPKKEKRKQAPATPFNVTDKNKHLVSIEKLNEIPEHIKNLDKPIPPNWRNVMVSPDPKADLLAIGKDDQNRPQYIYSKAYVEKSKSNKFNRIKELINKQEELDTFIHEIDDKETSDCLDLILKMGIRPGSTRDTKSKVEALGATTIRGENVVEENGKVYLRFTGKDGVDQNHLVESVDLSNNLIERKKKSGDKGDLFDTSDVKLRVALKPFGILPKDLRTLLATNKANSILKDINPTDDPKEFAKIRNKVGDEVCEILGNQRSMALNSYIDPSVFENWSGKGFNSWKNKEKAKKEKEK